MHYHYMSRFIEVEVSSDFYEKTLFYTKSISFIKQLSFYKIKTVLRILFFPESSGHAAKYKESNYR